MIYLYVCKRLSRTKLSKIKIQDFNSQNRKPIMHKDEKPKKIGKETTSNWKKKETMQTELPILVLNSLAEIAPRINEKDDPQFRLRMALYKP